MGAHQLNGVPVYDGVSGTFPSLDILGDGGDKRLLPLSYLLAVYLDLARWCGEGMAGGVLNLFSEGYPGLVKRDAVNSFALKNLVLGKVWSGGGKFPSLQSVRLRDEDSE